MNTALAIIETLPKAKLRKIINDPIKTAEAINLIYVTDQTQGIGRKKKGKNYAYYFKEKKLADKAEIKRIKSLVIPPAWEQVWICPMPNGHLQVTGLDMKQRKQYRYHQNWNILRNQTKFFRLLDFGKALPIMRLQLEKDISKQGLSQEKVLAAVVMLMEHTNIRIGNNIYEKLYGSFGLTTLKDKHVDVKGNSMTFSLKGKKAYSMILVSKIKSFQALYKNARIFQVRNCSSILMKKALHIASIQAW